MEVTINIDMETARRAIVDYLRSQTKLLDGVPVSEVKFELYANASKPMAGIVSFTQRPEMGE